MNLSLEQLKGELEAFGASNDAAEGDRNFRMLNISRETGALLSILVRAMRARRILEIGTSNGYSTLWLGEAAKATGGHVTTIEKSDYKIGLATSNFARAGLDPYIGIIYGDAGDFLQDAASDRYDLIFLDSERQEYCQWWPDIRRVLRPAGLLIVDNAVSHAQELAEFIEKITNDSGIGTCLVPVGNGEFLALRSCT